MKVQSVPYTAIYTGLRPSRVSQSVYSDTVSLLLCSTSTNFLSLQEAASLSVEAGLGGGRSLLQARGGHRERERERERQRRIKEKAGIYAPVEFKVVTAESHILGQRELIQAAGVLKEQFTYK